MGPVAERALGRVLLARAAGAFGAADADDGRDHRALAESPVPRLPAVSGVCVWLNCGPFGCSLVTVPKVRHRSPDVVVSAYHETGENPWLEMQPVTRAAQAGLEGGLTAEASRRQHTNLRFKNVDAIGHPLAGR